MDSHLTHLDTAAAGLALGAAAAGGATALLSVVGRGLAREGAPADEPNLRSAVWAYIREDEYVTRVIG